ncbi:MAG: 2-dehydropantoate 2-reductase [Rhodobacteraceae bacterium]|nr:2-dehydropantoate 2-reductase [Paracoccaceae bacterium]
MRFAVMGAGALGAYFGGRLAAAGYDVTLIARGAHLEALRRDGLRIESPRGDLHLPNIAATDDPNSVGEVDSILFFVKNYDVRTAAEALRPMLGGDTFVATFQNGVTAPGEVAEVIGKERVIGGVARIPAEVSAPGMIKHTDPADTLLIGEMEGPVTDRARALHEALVKAGTRPEISEDIEAALWQKFVLLSATSAITCLTRLNFGQIAAHPGTADLMRQAMEETAAVARALRPDLPADMAEVQYQAYRSMDGGVRSSMYTDLAAGKRLELDWISGEVVRRGEALGVETPLHRIVLAALSPYAQGRPA